MKWKEITIQYVRKVPDPLTDYSSITVGGFIMLTNDGDDDKDQAFDSGLAWLKAKANEELKSIHQSAHKTTQSEPQRSPQPIPQPEQQRVPIDDGGNEYDIFEAETILIEYMPSGDKRARVKGGNWHKWGVVCWPEVLAEPPLEWDINTLDAAEYQVPPGVKAKALMVDGTPKKVVTWM